MSATSINTRNFEINSAASDRTLLTARPDMHIVWIEFLAAALIAVAGAVVSALPISESAKVAFLPLAGLFIVTIGYSAIMYETLVNAVFIDILVSPPRSRECLRRPAGADCWATISRRLRESLSSLLRSAATNAPDGSTKRPTPFPQRRH